MITIPSDDEGFVPMKCPKCGRLFEVRAVDLGSDDYLNICCPSCGLESDFYFDADVLDLAGAIVFNEVQDRIFNAVMQLSERTKDNTVSVKRPQKPEHEHVGQLWPKISTLQKVECPECGRMAKVNPLLAASASYCPFCGVIRFAD